MSKTSVPASVDFIIIGGGLAGCTLASRLHQGSPSLSILIVEAGADPTGHPLTSAPLAAFAAHETDIDWAYTTSPQASLNNRPIYAPAGKALSGGSATNYGTWTRGAAVDYDHWAKTVGDSRWSYKGMLPYFRKTEHHYDPQGDATQHGFEGPIYTATISTSSPKRKYPLREPLLAAWNKVGVPHIQDSNSGSQLGVAEMVENWRDGKRQMARDAYNLSGVQILTETLVQRIVLEEKDGEQVATGVELADGTGRIISANKEVILSAGAYRTPQVRQIPRYLNRSNQMNDSNLYTVTAKSRDTVSTPNSAVLRNADSNILITGPHAFRHRPQRGAVSPWHNSDRRFSRSWP
jgi:choline dehydrogenase-like flavoprotein